MHGFDVESLFAVPALFAALVGPADRIVGAVLGLDLAEVHRRLAVGRRVLVGVLLDRGRGERVDDRHRLAVAVEATGDGCLGAVGALQWVGRVAARRVRQELPGRRRAGPWGLPLSSTASCWPQEVEHGGALTKAGDGGASAVSGLMEPVAAVEAGDAGDAAQDRARDAEVAVGRLQRPAAVLVGAQLRVERLLDLGRRAAGLDPAVVGGPIGADREAGLLEVGGGRWRRRRRSARSGRGTGRLSGTRRSPRWPGS